MWERIWEVMRKEFRQTLREPRMRAALFIPPIIQMLIFGYSVNMDVEHARLVWIDRDRTPISRDLLAAFDKELKAFIGTPEHLALVTPIGFGKGYLPTKTTAQLCAAK